MSYSIAFFVSFSLIILIITSTSAEELFQKGIEQYKKENYEEALEIFEKIYQTQPSTIVSFYLGLTYKQIGDYKAARDYFYKSLTGIPKINDAYVEIAEVLYHLNQLNEAMKWLAEAEREFIMPSKVLFLKGLVLSKMGKFDEARYSFEKAKSIDPALTQASDLQIALTYSSERKIKEAMKTLEGLIKIEPKTDIAEFASEYLTALKTVFKQWSINFSIAYQYDDNVLSKPATQIGVPAIDEISGKKDSAIVSNFRISYKPILEDSLFFIGELGLYKKNYLSMHRFNTTMGTITFNPGLRIREVFLNFPINYSHMWLYEKEYSSLFSINPTLSFPLYRQHILQIIAGYSKREILRYNEGFDPDEDRDSNQYSFSLGYFFPFNEKGIVYSRYEYSVDDTQGKNWESQSHKVSLGIIYPVIDRLSIQVASDHTWQNYRNTNTYSGKGVKGFPEKSEKRKDRIYTLSSGLIFEISKTLRMNLNYYHLRADSNFPIYDYKRNIYTVELSFSF
ncbi:MAG: tetratricopeptide repeat protein [Thermodesulfovibrio sp.]